MKVETPQILWNSDADKGKNAPLLSIDMIESGIANHASSQSFSHVLVTAGNATCINLWKVSFGMMTTTATTSSSSSSPLSSLSQENNNVATTSNTIFQKQAKPLNQIDYMMSLTRHERTVNTVAFSPNGLHLATAGDSGNIVLWSVPVHKRGNRNGRHFWSTLKKESDLSVRIVSTHAEGIVDISWSADSKRFAVGTIDSCLMIYEDKHYAVNSCSPETHQKESEWTQVFRNAEHASFVQGVAYDPLDVYVASMGNDRTVRVFPRKTPPKSKKKVLRPANAGSRNVGGINGTLARTVTPPQDHQRLVAQILSEARVEMGKPKRIKHRIVTVEDDSTAMVTSTTSSPADGQQRQIKQKLFVDEANCESFFRRLSWTVDGAFLVTPAALWHATLEDQQQHGDSSTSPSFATYLFARHRFDEPYRVLTGLDKPSVVVRPNPVLFELPPSALDDSKENQSPAPPRGLEHALVNTSSGLPYRSIFAVLTLDSVLVYDTHHSCPLAVLQGLHYSGLTDCCWSEDGMNLMICSSDGYISIVNFAHGELGEVYMTPNETTSNDDVVVVTSCHAKHGLDPPIEDTSTPLPKLCSSSNSTKHCNEDDETAVAVLVAPAAKKAKRTRITPILISTTSPSATAATVPSSRSDATSPFATISVSNNTVSTPKATTTTTSTSKTSSALKRAISDTETERVGAAVTKLSLNGADVMEGDGGVTNNKSKNNNNTSSNEDKPQKKKKRIQPMLISN